MCDCSPIGGQEPMGSSNGIWREGLEEDSGCISPETLSLLYAAGRSRPRPSDAAIGFAARRGREGLGGKEVHGGLRHSIWRSGLESVFEWGRECI